MCICRGSRRPEDRAAGGWCGTRTGKNLSSVFSLLNDQPPNSLYRYLLVELVFGSAEDGNTALSGSTPRSVLSAVKEAILSLHGDYGLAAVQQSLNIKYLNAVTRVMMIRCPRDHHKGVWSALTTITSLKGVPCAVHMLHVGGTIKSCQRALVKHNQHKLKAMVASATNPGTWLYIV